MPPGAMGGRPNIGPSTSTANRPTKRGGGAAPADRGGGGNATLPGRPDANERKDKDQEFVVVFRVELIVPGQSEADDGDKGKKAGAAGKSTGTGAGDKAPKSSDDEPAGSVSRDNSGTDREAN